MKKLLFLFLSMIMMSGCAFAKKNLFGSLPDGDNVQRVYIGGPMLKAAGYISAVGKYNSAIKSASGIEVYNIESPTEKERDTILKEVEAITKKYVCEEVVRQQSGNESNVIYIFYGPNTQKDGNSETNGMLIVNIDSEDINLVYISGAVDFSSLVL